MRWIFRTNKGRRRREEEDAVDDRYMMVVIGMYKRKNGRGGGRTSVDFEKDRSISRRYIDVDMCGRIRLITEKRSIGDGGGEKKQVGYVWNKIYRTTVTEEVDTQEDNRSHIRPEIVDFSQSL